MRGTFYWVCIANLVITTVYYSSVGLLEIFACWPREKIWNNFAHGKCVNIYPVNVVTSVLNLILDLIMLGMPPQVIWRMQLSARKKVAISAIFSVGVL